MGRGRIVIFIVFIMAAVLVCGLAYAGGAGNCVRPIKTTSKWLGIGGAFEYNYVDERMNDLDNHRGAGDMKITSVSQIYGKGIIGLGDYVNFYGKAGGSNYDLEFVDRSQQDLLVIELEDGVYTGGGINAHFPLTEIDPVSFGVGFDIQGNFFYNKVKSIKRWDRAATAIGGSFYGVDGQNSVYLTCKYDIEPIKTSVVPYVGGYHSWAVVGTYKTLTYEVKDHGYVEEDFQAAYDFLSFGLLVGVDLDVAQYVNLNVEGRFVGETAITTGATIKF